MKSNQPEPTKLCQMIESYFSDSDIEAPLETLSFMSQRLFEMGKGDDWSHDYLKDCHSQIIRLMKFIPELQKLNEELIERQDIPTVNRTAMKKVRLYRDIEASKN